MTTMDYEVFTGSRLPVKAWTRGVQVEDAGKEQLLNLAGMPFVHSHVAAMPDVHWGMGATVGSVIATKGAIIPAAVGVDIGCGMAAQPRPAGARRAASRSPNTSRRSPRCCSTTVSRPTASSRTTASSGSSYALDQGFEYYDDRTPVPPLPAPPPFSLRKRVIDFLMARLPERVFDGTYRKADAIADELLDRLELAHAAQERWFLFANFMDAHAPYTPPEPFRSLFPGRVDDFTYQDFQDLANAVNSGRTTPDPRIREHMLSQYDLTRPTRRPWTWLTRSSRTTPGARASAASSGSRPAATWYWSRAPRGCSTSG